LFEITVSRHLGPKSTSETVDVVLLIMVLDTTVETVAT
jgi:hypothetical protein